MIAGLTWLVGFQLVGLVRYVEKTNHDLDRFLRSIRYSDFSQTFEGGRRGKSFELLGRAFSEVMDEFRAERAEKEESYRYLQTVMQHVGIGLLSFRQDGTVGLINTAAKRLLRVSHLKHLRALEATAGRGLADTLLRMRSGEKVLVKVVDDDELLQLAIYATEFKLRGDLYKLVSIQDIQSELEEKEIEAWQKLTRVLTHEIMNSITPIASLASTVNDLLADLDAPPADGAADEAADEMIDEMIAETIDDVRDAVRTIEKRSQSLLDFVQAYRSLTRIPKPDFRIVPVADLVENVAELLRLQLRERGIRLVTSVQPASLTVTADPSLVEQVLINLLKNAAEAVQGRADAEIRLSGAIDERGRTILQVVDNGSGDGSQAYIRSLSGIRLVESGRKGIEEIEFLLRNNSLKFATVELDISLARGLNYYTGSIFEIKANAGTFTPSIAGGGRYDDLTGVFGLDGMSGVGISFGIDRIYDVLEDLSLFPESVAKQSSTTVLFTHFEEETQAHAMKLAAGLR